MIKPPAAHNFPIINAAAALGLQLEGRRAHCFNRAGHKDGDDTHPSLAFFPEVNGFRCYACGAKGDVIGLVRAVRGVGYREAVAWLESLGSNSSSIAAYTSHEGQRAIFPDNKALEVYEAFFENCYEIGPDMPAGKYLQQRGLDIELADDYGAAQMGNPQELWSELIDRFGEERLKAAGLVSKSGRFLFAQHSLLFFYSDDGRPVYVQARDVTGEAACKELSLAGLRSPVPFNVELLAEEPEQVYVCEGCIDTISAIQLGYPAIGVPGVIGFCPEWFERFKKSTAVHILFDNDAAGHRHAAELRTQFRLRGIRADASYPQGAGVKDMNDFLIFSCKGV